jgi:hypothetical protein
VRFSAIIGERRNSTHQNLAREASVSAYISGMMYRLDPKNPRLLTDEEARRLDEAAIDYSDIPELGDEFFSRAQRAMTDIEFEEARRLLRILSRA